MIKFVYNTYSPQQNEQNLNVFERKVLRRTFGPLQDNGTWRSRYNDELRTLFKEPKLTTDIKTERLLWAGHVQRMAEDQMPKLDLVQKYEEEGMCEDQDKVAGTGEKGCKKIGIRRWWSRNLAREE
jgi:hypothetical protein